MMTGRVNGSAMSLSQALPMSVEHTVRFLRRRGSTTARSSGANSPMLCPLSQWSIQKKVEAPFPTVVVMDALKNTKVSTSFITGIATHGFPGSVRVNHNHRRRSAPPPRTPKPPNSSGSYTLSQATRHLAS
jgi:hypothetical protein